MKYTISFKTQAGSLHPVEVTFTEAKIPLSGLVTPLQRICDQIINVELAGQRISCCKGCSSCCVQLVPLAIPEAFALAELLRQLPANHSKRVRQRFAKNKNILNSKGLLGKLKNPATAAGLDKEYFNLGLPCPFLEDGVCSIYTRRPFVCREYFVLSDPAFCRQPYTSSINRLPLALPIGPLLAAFAARLLRLSRTPVPHILAPDWAAAFSALEQQQFAAGWMMAQLAGALAQVAKTGGKIKEVIF